NNELKSLAEEVYKIGVGANISGNDSLNNYPLDNFRVMRVALGSYAEDGKDTLAHHKSVIDKAISENSWVIFMTHVWAHGSEGDKLLADVIDYAQSKSVNIVNLDEGLEIFGDRLNVKGLIRVTPDDRILSDKIVPVYKTPLNGARPNSPITDFIKGGITYTEINHNMKEGFPENSNGILKTNYFTQTVGHPRQEYNIYNTNNNYVRYWKTTNEWSEWEKRQGVYEKEFIHDFVNVPAKSSVQKDFSVDGAKIRDKVIITNLEGLQDGLFLDGRVTAANKVTVKMHN